MGIQGTRIQRTGIGRKTQRKDVVGFKCGRYGRKSQGRSPLREDLILSFFSRMFSDTSCSPHEDELWPK